MINNNRMMQEVADTLLDVGVSLPLAIIPLPFGRRIRLGITIKRPTLGSLIRISRHYLLLNTTMEDIEQQTTSERIAFLAEHGKTISEIIALCCLRGKLLGRLLYRPLAWLIRHLVKEEIRLVMMLTYMQLINTQSFTTFIGFWETTNPLMPSQAERES